jgi:CRISPR system Cascade subunit CasD
MTARHTLLLRLIGPMQAWGYRSRFEDRDTGLEPTRSGILGLLASARGIPREDRDTLTYWDTSLRLGVRVEVPAKRKWDGSTTIPTGFRVERDFHTAQDVFRASGSGRAETVLSMRHYLTDARFSVGLESIDLELLREIEAALKNPCWTLSLGRKSFPLSVPPWLPEGGIREGKTLLDALKSAPWLLLHDLEVLPNDVTFVIEPDNALSEIPDNAIPMRLPDRPLDFAAREFGVRQVALFRAKTQACGMEEDRCFFPK